MKCSIWNANNIISHQAFHLEMWLYTYRIIFYLSDKSVHAWNIVRSKNPWMKQRVELRQGKILPAHYWKNCRQHPTILSFWCKSTQIMPSQIQETSIASLPDCSFSRKFDDASEIHKSVQENNCEFSMSGNQEDARSVLFQTKMVVSVTVQYTESFNLKENNSIQIQ